MTRPRSPNRDKAKLIYLRSSGKKKLKDIAKELGVSPSQIRKWKNQDSWDSDLKGLVTLPNNEQNNSNVTNETKRKGAPKGNKYALGNKGGPGGKIGNKNSEKHGFYAKYFPKETMELFDDIESLSPVDILWDSIKIKYLAILRAQKIMFVKDKEDKTVEKTGYSEGKTISETWEVQQAWDKHASFLQAQSRAMRELTNMIKQFNELAHADDTRLLEIKRIEANIEKTKAITESIRKEGKEENDVVDEWIQAMGEIDD